MSRMALEGFEDINGSMDFTSDEDEIKEEFYTYGPHELKPARREILNYSMSQ